MAGFLHPAVVTNVKLKQGNVGQQYLVSTFIVS